MTAPPSHCPEDVTEIVLTLSNGVAVLTLNAPERLNAFTPAMATAALDCLETVRHDATIGALVVAATGRAFCSGADLGVLATAGFSPAGEESFGDLGMIYRVFQELFEFPVPTVCCVNGAAVGAGFNLALAADVRLVAPEARFISGFGRVGLHPGGGHFELLAAATRRDGAGVLGLLGAPITGARAVEIGLAWELVARDELMSRALDLLQPVATDPRLSREVTATYRLETGQMGRIGAGSRLERASQMWSLHRRTD